MQIEIKDGHVFKDGEEVGTIKGSTVTLTKTIGPTVKAAIKRETGDDSIKFEIAADEPETETVSTGETVTVSAPMSDAELLAEMQKRGLVPAAPQVAPRPSGQPTERENRFLTKQEILDGFAQIEAPPATLPQMGDKTPEYVAWVQRHASPEQWEKIYGTRIQRKGKLPSMEDYEKGEKRRLAMMARLPTETTGTKGDND